MAGHHLRFALDAIAWSMSGAQRKVLSPPGFIAQGALLCAETTLISVHWASG